VNVLDSVVSSVTLYTQSKQEEGKQNKPLLLATGHTALYVIKEVSDVEKNCHKVHNVESPGMESCYAVELSQACPGVLHRRCNQ